MSKIVKYCSKCEESFAEKFGFCPTCGAALQTFEMKPVSEAIAEESAPKAEPAIAAVEPPAPVIAAPIVIEPPPVVAAPVPTPVIEVKPEPVVRPIPLGKAAPAPVPAWQQATPAIPVYTAAKPVDADRKPTATNSNVVKDADGGFYVTVIEDKNVGTRNGLLLATLVFVICALTTGLVYNIFSKDLDIGAINGDDLFNAVIAETTPMTVEEEKVKKEKDDGGGGGGGGKNEKDPASQGDMADQSKTPTRPPDVNTPKSDTPMLQTPTTEGTMKFPKIYGKWGDPNGVPGNSNGDGSGGGIGSGRGTGQGNGNGTGAGNGNGSGFGNGNGNGNGDGNGDGDGLGQPPPKVAAVTSPLKIISKPRGAYTDAARQNAAQGTVTLKITFLASGQIGSISTVSGMSYGLTESAIAAARQIRFEPQKINGIPQTVTKTFQYNFTLY